MARRRRENPPHWYFPISYEELHRRKMANIDRALKKIGMTRKELNEKYKHLEKGKNKKNGKRKRRRK